MIAFDGPSSREDLLYISALYIPTITIITDSNPYVFFCVLDFNNTQLTRSYMWSLLSLSWNISSLVLPDFSETQTILGTVP
jgi:hypothetical protein